MMEGGGNSGYKCVKEGSEGENVPRGGSKKDFFFNALERLEPSRAIKIA